MKNKKPILVLLGILIIATFLRFYQLGKVPASPDWDEVALGYNAYSILKTGRDEYGKFLPLELRSYDDYKPPLYAYLAIPSVAIFGLNVWAVRLPSAVMGVIAVGATYLLVKKLLEGDENEKKKKGVWSYPVICALLAAFLFAISPWSLQFSRIAFEANSGVTLIILGVLFFLYGLSSWPFLAFSAFFFGISLYIYQTERVFSPLLVLALAIIWRKELFRDFRRVIVAVVIGVLIAAPLVPIVFDKTALTRLRGTSPLTDQTALLADSVKKLEQDQARGDKLGMILDNRRIVYVKTVIDGYISHFSFEWLFLTGDENRHHAPDNGILYLWSLPFVVWGIVELWKRGGKTKSLIFTWFFLAPVAAAPTGGTPHAIRTLVFLPTFQLFNAMGLLAAVSYVVYLRWGRPQPAPKKTR